MKKRITAMLLATALTQSVWADTNSAHTITRTFRECIPTNWTATPSTKPAPLRGLTNPSAQIELRETTKTLTREWLPGRFDTFHPNLILLAFTADRSKEIEAAVEEHQFRSDYPPLVFCSNDRYIFVTSPGYINRGLFTPEARATLTQLTEALAECMEIEWDIEPKR